MDLWDSCDQTEDIFVLTHRRCLLGKDLMEVPLLLSPTLSETELSIAKTSFHSFSNFLFSHLAGIGEIWTG